jgi:MFS family permease
MTRSWLGHAPVRRSGTPIFSGWVVVVAVCLVQLPAQGASSYLFSLVLVPMAQDLHWSRGLLSGAYSLGYVALALVLVPTGILVDRVGARPIMVAGSLLGAATLLGAALVQAPWECYLLWGLGLGLTQALLSVQVGATAIANWFVRRRGAALAWLAVGVGLASPIYAPVASRLIDQFGWRVGLALLAVPFVAIAMPASLFVGRRPEDVGLQPDGEVGSGSPDLKPHLDGASLREASRHRALWLLSVSSVLPAIAWGVVNTHQFAFLLGRGIDLTLAATLVGLGSLVGLPGRYALNVLADRFGAKRMLILVLALQACGILLLLGATSPALVFVYAVVYSSTTGAAFGLRSRMIGDLFGRRAFGAITALHGTLIYLGGAIGPIVGGILFDTLHTYDLALSIAALITGVSIIGLLPMRSTRAHRT